jgi:SAM-dependent methyltransferase
MAGLQNVSADANPAETPAAFSNSRWPSKFIYGLTIFLSAFLLFEIQPIIAKIILPWFGGSAAVWSVCLLFFQTALLLGYLYSHLLIRHSRSRVHISIHLVLLAASILMLPVLPKDSWKPLGHGDPTWQILLLLVATIGLPYFLLSATSPLVQAWYARARSGAIPYRFYALSNAGSLLALLSYPVIIEPFFSRSHQAWGWSGAFLAFVVLSAAVAFASRHNSPAEERRQISPRPGWKMQLLWVALAACASILLLAVTNHISQNIAAVPFLWILPLSLYLFSLILCFEGRAWYQRGVFLRLLGVALGGMAYALAPSFTNLPFVPLIGIFCAGLFICCMFCHGELARLKPPAEHLTLFYFMFSLGGALGAVFVALVAPHVFNGFYELHIGLAACALLALAVLRAGPSLYGGPWKAPWLTWLVLVTLAGALIASLAVSARGQASGARLMVRNFYGALRVIEVQEPEMESAVPKRAPALPGEDLRVRELFNGAIKHGVQFLSPARRREPTSYYGRESGVGLALGVRGLHGPLRVGVIGLGAGTLAAYGRAGDHFTFYEINPLVIRIANEQFIFLRDSPAQINIELGDARLTLEREEPQKFDVLAVDAFSGDSIPVHLLTREAFELYFRHLKPDGVLCVHISNRYLSLEPVVAAAAASLNKQATLIVSDSDDAGAISVASWVEVSSLQGFSEEPSLAAAGKLLGRTGNRYLWTDDYSSLIRILK